jgi:hypothetical protein
MSKMDEIRALREARYERTLARAAEHRAAAPPQRSQPAATEPVAVDLPASEPEVRLCGHRAISGRTCTREHGHAAKSHRYS